MQSEEDELDKLMKKQSEKLFYMRDNLQQFCKKKDLQNILLENNSELVTSIDRLLDRCADFMAFGAIQKCPKCLTGDLKFYKHGYLCNGETESDGWVKCENFVEKPQRVQCILPSELKRKKADFFKTYDSTLEDRAVRPPNDASGSSVPLANVTNGYVC